MAKKPALCTSCERITNSAEIKHLFLNNLFLPVKQPFGERALKLSTGLILLILQGEKWLLFFLSPDVARANIMKFPSSPPGVQTSGSCWYIQKQNCYVYYVSFENIHYCNLQYCFLQESFKIIAKVNVI